VTVTGTVIAPGVEVTLGKDTVIGVLVGVAVGVLVGVAVGVFVGVLVGVLVGVVAGIETLPLVAVAAGMPSLNLNPG